MEQRRLWLHQPGAYTPGDNAFASFAPSSGYNPATGNRFWRTIAFRGRSSQSGTFSAFGSGPRNAIDPILLRAFAVHRRGDCAGAARGGSFARKRMFTWGGDPTSPASYQLIDWTDLVYSPAHGYALESVRSIRTPTSQFDLLHHFSGGRIEWTRGAGGETVYFDHDALGRVIAERFEPFDADHAQTTLFWHNAAGDVTSRATVPGVVARPADPDNLNESTQLIHRFEFDRAGRLTRKISPGCGCFETRWSYEKVDGFHRRVRRTEDMPTARNLERNYEVHRVETYNLDGTLRSVTGEAAVARYLDHSIDAQGRIRSTTHLNTETDARWQETTSDWLGRVVETRRPLVEGTKTDPATHFVETFAYYGPSAAPGSVASCGSARNPAATPTSMNTIASGELFREGLDYHNNDNLAPASLDRLVEYESKVVFFQNAYFLETSMYGFPTG